MNRLPKKVSLSVQACIAIKEEIASGRWSRWLPGEHELSARLHVSRRTVRAALKQLHRDGVVKCLQGKRREIIRGIMIPSESASSRVVLLSPVPLHQTSPFSIFLIDRMREHLAEEGFLLEIHVGHDPYRAGLSQQLKKVEKMLHPAGWVLLQSTEAMQRWFARNRLRCVVLGSCFPEVELSSVGFDYAAVCRHAVGQFIARGHHRLVLLNPLSRAAGDVEAETGFREAVQKSRVQNIESNIIYHDGTVENIGARLDALMREPNRPTALLVSRAYHVISVLGHLSVRGFCVPRDVAIISRDDDSYLENVVPSLARYSGNPDSFASKLSRVVLTTIRGEEQATEHKLMPKFLPGQTLIFGAARRSKLTFPSR